MTDSMMEPYRALDLSDEKGVFCGVLLAYLGIDVIKVEKPGGDVMRSIGPFFHNVPDTEKSLLWFAYNVNKRSITLNIESREGGEVFKELVKSADFVIESFAPGYMDSLGLGYEALSDFNPRIIMTSITPFGQKGPRKDWKCTDIVAMAMGGSMYINGEPEREPLRYGSPQAYLLASLEATIGTLIAHHCREVTGVGQHVDQSVQRSVIGTLHNAVQVWDMMKRNQSRTGIIYQMRPAPASGMKAVWECQDGYITYLLLGGLTGARMHPQLFKWMDEEGMCPDFLKEIRWEEIDLTDIPQDLFDRISQPLEEFFKTHSKRELYEEAAKRNIFLYPVAGANDLVTDSQLAARNFWVELEHPELENTISYSGPFVKASETPICIERRSPLIGEHNVEIYQEELGLSSDALSVFRAAGII